MNDCDGSTSCTCEACVARRHSMILTNHPIHSQKDKPITATLVPPDQALAMWLGLREEAEERLAHANSEILILRGCAEVQG